MKFANLDKLKPGDKVAILSPSFAAPGKWPHVHALGLKRLKELFGLEPVEFPATRKLDASKEERAADLISAFENQEIKAVITTLGGDDQVTSKTCRRSHLLTIQNIFLASAIILTSPIFSGCMASLHFTAEHYSRNSHSSGKWTNLRRTT